MRYHGNIGFATTVETAPSVYSEVIVPRSYSGDLIRSYRKIDNSAVINSSVTISNELSIVADKYAYDHISDIRYAEFSNQKWNVISIDIQPPRMILTIGSVYNEQTN